MNLSCDDGTNLDLTVDTSTLLDLQNAVQAMVLYPAGISCGVTQLPSASILNLAKPAYADSAHDFAVGAVQVAGETVNACVGDITANVSAHKDTGAADTTATGHIIFNGTGTCSGQEKVDVNCLNVAGSLANLSGTVTKATGYFATLPAATGGTQNVSIKDNPSPIDDLFGTAQLGGACDQEAYNQTVESGNFVVRSGS